MVGAENRKQRVEHEIVGDTFFTVIVEENPNAENTALDVIGTIIKQNADRNIGKQQRENNKGRICYLNTDGGYYSAEGYDLIYTTERPAAPEMMASGTQYTFDAEEFTVYQGASQISDFSVELISNSPLISVDGMTITAGSISADTYATITVRITCGDSILEYTVEILLTDATVLDETYYIDYLDPATYTIDSAAIDGAITSVNVDMREIATSADLTEWVKSFSHVAAQDQHFNMLIHTDSDQWYLLPVTLGAAYEEVDLINGVTITQNGTDYEYGDSNQTLWTQASDTSVVGDRTDVMKFESDGPSDAWQSNVTIDNWSQNVGYYYWTFDFYIAEGTTGFRSDPRTPGELWTEPRVDQEQNSARNWYYTLNMQGEIVTSLEADTWYTMVMFVSPTSSSNGPFVKASASLYGLVNGEATTFYIDNMRFYTEDKFDLYTGE